jgi:hypothetical protein
MMPKEPVKAAFRAVWHAESMVLQNVKSAFGGTRVCIDPCVQNWPLIAEAVREAGGFTNVSKEALVIRLQDLGVLVNLTDCAIGWQAAPPV